MHFYVLFDFYRISGTTFSFMSSPGFQYLQERSHTPSLKMWSECENDFRLQSILEPHEHVLKTEWLPLFNNASNLPTKRRPSEWNQAHWPWNWSSHRKNASIDAELIGLTATPNRATGKLNADKPWDSLLRQIENPTVNTGHQKLKNQQTLVRIKADTGTSFDYTVNA